MVSENLFNDVLISNEQKLSSSILECTNFDEKMAQVDVGMPESSPLLLSSPTRNKFHTTGDVDESEIIIENGTRNNIDSQKDDSDGINSDIELTVGDDKEAPSESEDTITNGNTSVDHEHTLVLNKDIESIESLDIDLSNTANLVGKRFLQDDFDNANSLDSVDEALSKLPIEDIVRKSKYGTDCVSNFTERLQQVVSSAGAKQQAIESELKNVNNFLNNSDTEHNVTNNSTTELKPTESIADEESVKVKLENEPEDDFESGKKCSENESSTELPKTDDAHIPKRANHDSEPPEMVQTAVSKDIECNLSDKDNQMQVCTEEETIPEQELVEKVSEPQTSQDNVNIESAIKEKIAQEPEATVEHSKIQPPPSNEPQSEDILNQDNTDVPTPPSPPQPVESVGNFSLQVEIADNHIPVESTENILNEAPAISVIENQTSSNHVESSKNNDAPTLPDRESAKKTFPVPVNENAQIDDVAQQISQITDDPFSPVQEITMHSPSVDHIDVQCDESRSVDSTEIQIIEIPDEPEMQEVVDLDATDEPMEEDDGTSVNRPTLKIIVEQCSHKEKEENLLPTSENLRLNQLAESPTGENTRKKPEADIDMEIDSDPTATTNDLISGMCTTGTDIPLSVLNSFLDTESRKRKRDDSLSNNQTSENILEKRQKVNDVLETNDIDKENRTVTSPDKKKPSVNIARKHTSSTNVSKTIKEIEKKIRNDIIVRSRSTSREPTPAPANDFDQYDIILNENVAENVEINNCDDVLQNIDDSAHRISLNMDTISKENLKNIFKMMSTKLTRRQLEEIVVQKCCEMISDNGEIGELRKQVSELQQAEFYRKQKILNLEKQISQLKAVCQRYIEQVREAQGGKAQINPIKITRSVGLQVAIDSTPHVQPEPVSSNRPEDRLKKLFTTPTSNRKTSQEDRRETPSPRHITSGSTNLNKNTDPKIINNYSNMNGKVNSSLSDSPIHCTSPSPIPSRSSVLKKSSKPINDSNVIDLTDKDDRIDNEANVAANNLLASVNGSTVVTYVPIRMSQEHSRQTIKPGTQLIVNGQLMTVQSKGYTRGAVSAEHPAPVPITPTVGILPGTKPMPPKPTLRIAKNGNGIMLSWSMPDVSYAKILKYQLFAYQETNIPPAEDLWKAVGDVDALPLPMACTLTQFVEGFRYHFIVRAVDVHHRIGPFSSPESIIL